MHELSNGVLTNLNGYEFSTAKGMAVNGTGDVFVADSYALFDLSGGKVSALPLPIRGNSRGTVAADAKGNIYIADTGGNQVIGVVNGSVLVVAGNGTAGFAGDGGPAVSAELRRPYGVAVDSAGNLYIADSYNERIRMVSGGIITTISGTGTVSADGDGGPALSAAVGTPYGVAVDSTGDVFFSDISNQKIRELVPSGAPTCTYSVSPAALTTDVAGGDLSVTVQTGAGCAWTIQSLPGWITSGSTVMLGPLTIKLTVAQNSGADRTATIALAGIPVTVTQASPAFPEILSQGVVPVYGSSAIIQPGSWISIFGKNFAQTSTTWNGDFPQSLGGVSVTIDGQPAYLWYVSPTQINLQAPDETSSGVYKPVNVVVTTPNGTASSQVYLYTYAPSLNMLDATHAAGVIPTSDGSGAYANGSYDLLGPAGAFGFSTRPAKPGETIELYGVGFGRTSPQVRAGAPFSGSAPMLNKPTVTIGGVRATVAYAGITSAGLYQFNIVVPAITGPSGDYPVVISLGNGDDALTSATTTVTLQIPAQ